MGRLRDKKNIAIIILSLVVFILLIVVLSMSINTHKSSDRSTSDTTENKTITDDTQEPSGEVLFHFGETEESTPHLEEYEAKQIATSEFDSRTSELERRSGSSRIDLLNVETVELSDKQNDRYTFSFKGNFWGLDEYGIVKAKYTFDMDLVVDNYGNSYMRNCTVRKAY